MDFPWGDFLISAALIGGWTLFWKFVIDSIWSAFGPEIISLVSILEGESDERPNVER